MLVIVKRNDGAEMTDVRGEGNPAKHPIADRSRLNSVRLVKRVANTSTGTPILSLRLGTRNRLRE